MGLVGQLFGRERAGVGLFVDGPNVFRSEFDVDLDDLRSIASAYGDVRTAKLYLDEHATPGLIQAGEAHGFAVVTTSGDVDVKLAVDGTRAVSENHLETVVVASRDIDFKPVLEVAAEAGCQTVAVAPGEYGRSAGLAATAHESHTLGD
ncbi:NYN domain-containing protein [Halorhabdus sp. CBA1104]|uniref:NYN domain-containing protein n=1 Tax=unclassified Halorhabdus TaxID=2621901 RepID=UPI0012B2615F|nr:MULTISPECIES: NYN domain-containing protein [unclassified Halorhabdus]QGN08188.1 NYN domain-containing protein [Halorhabdus sp. CBA1104]